MATNYVTGTPGDDFLGPTAGVNNYTGGAGDDAIDGTDGVNTINFAAGDGVDTVNFAMPRTYQFADFLSAAQQALNDLSSFSGSQYSNAYFASADTSLLYALPPDIANTLAAFQTPQVDADGNEIPGSVSPTDAKAAFQALEDWINTPTSNVVKFGPGITLNDLTFTLGATTPLNSGDATIPTNFSVAINGTEGVVFSMPTTAVAGSPALPPQLNLQFQFADGSTATLADLMSSPNQTSTLIYGTAGNDVLHGTLLDDTITGGDGNDQIDGNAGNDTIAGGSGDDVIAGGSGYDVLSGNEGNDVLAVGKGGGMLSGGAGNDVYAINRGDGPVTIDNSGNNPGDTDTVSFGPGIRPQDLVASVSFGELTLSVNGTGDQINIPTWFNPDGTPNPDQSIAYVQFVDASGNVQVFDLAGLVNSHASTLLAASGDAPVALFGPGSDAFDVSASVEPAGGDAALQYALTGSPFDSGVSTQNQGPVIGAAIGNHEMKQGDTFNLPLPAGAFVDSAGAPLTYALATADGQPIPAWVNFDRSTGRIWGTPDNDAVGTVSVKVTASDPTGLAATQMFDITVDNVNDAPTVANHEAGQTATQDKPFSYQVPANTFADIDVGDSLTLSAKLANGDALPSWLNFDASTGTFSGTPANGDVGALSVQVTATDTSGASVSDVFGLTVANVNDAPTVANHEAGQTATQDKPFSYQVPANTFADIDVGDSLTLKATLANGDALPSWLSFNPSTGTFTGTPANGDVGALSIKVTATDGSGVSVSDVFGLAVQNVNDAPTLAKPIANQTGTAGSPFTLTVPGDTFKDIDAGDVLKLSAMQANGDPLPSWLTFDAATGKFSGTAGAAGQWSIEVVATDLSGATATDVFSLNVGAAPVNPDPSDPIITGTNGNDTLNGTAGNDQISGGRGNDKLYGRDGDDILLGGSGRDQLDGGAGNDYLFGGSGKDTLQGGTGVDLLQGGTNNDVLRDTSGNGLMDGGRGTDEIHDGSNNSMIVGGKGNDKIYLGGGYDVLAFNRGDGKDSVYGGNGGSTVLSLGGGIRYQDLSLSRSGNNLILNLGAGDSITFEKWYSGRMYQSVTRLQMVVQASADYNPSSSDMLRDYKLETFDFNGLVKAFDTAMSKSHGLSKWTMTNALAQFHLGGSDTAALGGDVAYQYGMNGTLAGMGTGAARSAVGDSQFGNRAQTLHSEAVVKDGVVKLA